MAKIQPPPVDAVATISFYAAPPFAPLQTAHDMLTWIMEQSWADIKVSKGQVIISDLREGGGMGRVIATYTPTSAYHAPKPAPTYDTPAKVLPFRRPVEALT